MPKKKLSAKILVVEDETMLVKVYSGMLKKKGYDVTIACDGEEALRLAEKIVPDLILLDLLLPKLDGFEVLKALRARPETKDVRVIVLSNLGQEEDVKRSDAFGAEAYLIKANYSLDEIVEKIRNVLEKEDS